MFLSSFDRNAILPHHVRVQLDAAPRRLRHIHKTAALDERTGEYFLPDVGFGDREFQKRRCIDLAASGDPVAGLDDDDEIVLGTIGGGRYEGCFSTIASTFVIFISRCSLSRDIGVFECPSSFWRKPRTESAIHHDRRSGHERGIVAREEHRHARHFLGPSDAP